MAKEEREIKELEYTKPQIADYGDLEELTARAGGAFTDVPMGSPNSSQSTP